MRTHHAGDQKRIDQPPQLPKTSLHLQNTPPSCTPLKECGQSAICPLTIVRSYWVRCGTGLDRCIPNQPPLGQSGRHLHARDASNHAVTCAAYFCDVRQVSFKRPPRLLSCRIRWGSPYRFCSASLRPISATILAKPVIILSITASWL